MNKVSHRKIEFDESLTGSIDLNVYEIDSGFEGPTVYFQSSVHGAELQGNSVIYELFDYFKNNPFIGKVRLVPLANPYASSQKLGTYTFGRFNPVTGDNWNRMYLDLTKLTDNSKIDFKEFCKNHCQLSQKEIDTAFKTLQRSSLDSYLNSQMSYGISDNKRLFVELQKLASDADFVFDLHTGARATRYIYSPECQKDKMKDINFPHYILIPNEFGGAMDEATFVPWYTMASEMKKHKSDYKYNFESYTVELGSEEVICSKAAKEDACNILGLLSKRGVLKKEVKPKEIEQYSCELKKYKSYFSPTSGLCEYHIKPGEKFKKDAVLCTLLKMDRLHLKDAKVEIIALSDGIMIHQCPSASLKKGMELFQVFETPDKL